MHSPTLVIRSLLVAGLCSLVVGIAVAGPESTETPATGTPKAAKSKPTTAPSEKKPQPAVPGKNKPAGANKAALKALEVTPEREQAALNFAKLHHPELVDLITPLKESNPKEYQRAIRDLFRANERLSAVHAKDPARYELELEVWKRQSHIRLLAARLSMGADSELEQQLREAINQKSAFQLKLLQHEQETLAARLKQVQTQIEKDEKSHDQLVQDEFNRLTKKPKRPKATAGAGEKPAAKKSPSTKTPESAKPASSR